MENIEFRRLVTIGFKKRDGFMDMAERLVQTHTVDKSDEFKIDLSADVALGMAIGEAMTKNRNLLTGVTIGAIGTSLAVGVIYKIKNRKKDVIVTVTSENGNERHVTVNKARNVYEAFKTVYDELAIDEAITDLKYK